MKTIKSIAIIGLVGLSSILGYAQEDSAWQRTQATHYPISYKDPDWWLVASTLTNIDYFVSIKDIDIHKRIFSVWARMYDYKEKTVTFLKIPTIETKKNIKHLPLLFMIWQMEHY
jgi:hypothetical protein